jgi:hypothetical protein
MSLQREGRELNAQNGYKEFVLLNTELSLANMRNAPRTLADMRGIAFVYFKR